MALVDDLTSKVQELARERWEAIPNGYVAPSSDSLTFGNTGVHLDATVLYADIRGSTELVDSLCSGLIKTDSPIGC